MQELRVYLFGGVRVEINGESLVDLRLTNTVRVLMSYLLLYRQRAHSRDVLASLLWADYPQERARNSLNTAIWSLRRFLEPSGVEPGTYLISTSNGELGFNPKSDYWLDVAAFESQIGQLLSAPIEQVLDSQIQSAVQTIELYTADLLEGCYMDWALHERERLRTYYLDGSYYLMRYFYYAHHFVKAIAYGRQILNNDPLREEVHRQMMRAYMKNGQRSLAVKQYKLCCELLEAELGILPMTETQELFKQIVDTGSLFADTLEPKTVDSHPFLLQLQAAIESMDVARKNLQEVMDRLKMSSENDQIK